MKERNKKRSVVCKPKLTKGKMKNVEKKGVKRLERKSSLGWIARTEFQSKFRAIHKYSKESETSRADTGGRKNAKEAPSTRSTR
jgi:hypothetical protein